MASWWWLVAQLVASCCGAVVLVLWWLWTTRPRVDAPGPPTLPILGNILEFRQLPITIRKMRDFHRQYGDLTRLYFGPVLMLMVVHPDDVQHILVTSRLVERDPFSTRAMRTIIGDGLFSVGGSQWKVHRKLINPTFHSELLGGFLEAFHEGGLFLSERLARTKGVATEIHGAIFLTALRTICKTLGIDPDLLVPDAISEKEVSDAADDALTVMQKMVVRPWTQSKLLLRLTSTGRGLYKYVQLLQEGAMKCIAIRSAATEEGPAKTRRRLLEALVKPGGQTAIPLSEVRDELVTVMLAGTQTTATSMSYTLALLALHPEWQDAVRQELRDVFGDDDSEDFLRAATLHEMERLRVLDSVIKEALRLYPTVPLIPRKATEDVWLPGSRVLVPKGTMLAVMPCLTHRLPEFFPGPLRFDPSRFLDGSSGKKHPCSYFPFGLGARNCVGYQYARLVAKVYLASVLRRFRFLPHSRWEDLEHSVLSIGQDPIEPIKVSCVPLQETSP